MKVELTPLISRGTLETDAKGCSLLNMPASNAGNLESHSEDGEYNQWVGDLKIFVV